MANFKTAGGDRVLQFIFGLFTNQGVEVALCYALEERAHLVFLSVELKPVTSKPLAICRTDQRKPTPWTLPS